MKNEEILEHIHIMQLDMLLESVLTLHRKALILDIKNEKALLFKTSKFKHGGPIF